MSRLNTLAAVLPPAVLDIVLGRLALLFLRSTAGDMDAAREAAAHMLCDYNPATAEELSLAAEIVSLSLHTLDALGEAAGPELSPAKIMRLRSSAVSLSREAHKAERKLEQRQRARHAGEPPAAAEPAEIPPKIVKALAAVGAACAPIPTAKAGGKYDGMSWTQKYGQRQRDKRLAARQIQPLAADPLTPLTPLAG